MRGQYVGEVESGGDAESCKRRFQRCGIGVADAQQDTHFTELAAAGGVFQNAESDLFDFLLERGCGPDDADWGAEGSFEMLLVEAITKKARAGRCRSWPVGEG